MFVQTSTGETFVTTSCCLTIHILQMHGLKQCIDCTYSGTKFLNSYPSFKKPCRGNLYLQVTIMWPALLVSGQPQTHSARLPVR